MNKGIKILIISISCLSLIALIWGVNYYITFKKGNVVKNDVLYVYRSYSYEQMMDTLKSHSTIKNWKSLERAAKKMKLSASFKPGRYQLKEGMNNTLIVRTILFGWQTPRNIVFQGYARDYGRLALALSNWFEADSTSFAKCLNDSTIMKKYDFNKETFLGMFIPNTYQLYWTTEPEKVVERFYTEYNKFWNESRLGKAKAIGLSPKQVMTLASIVTEESNYAPEQPIIAGVYMNRLKKGMLLQADPTIRYVVYQSEPGVKRILYKHLKIDSPYNTYRYKGLPPGPIITPPICAIESVLNYEKHNYIYFCAKPEFDGTHSFTASYSQHLRNAKAYQKAYKVMMDAKN